MANSCDTSVAAGSLSSQAWSLPEDVRWSAEFLPAQVSPSHIKTQSLCEKGRDLGLYRVDAQVDGCLMTWEYLVRLRKRAFILPIIGIGGEQQDGYLGVVVQNQDAEKLVYEINALRKAKYSELAAKKGITLEQARKTCGKQSFSKVSTPRTPPL